VAEPRGADPLGGAMGPVDRARIEDEGTTLFTTLPVDRVFMFAGQFYGIERMRAAAEGGFALRPISLIGRQVCPESFPQRSPNRGD
jgi:hypothetical protein